MTKNHYTGLLCLEKAKSQVAELLTSLSTFSANSNTFTEKPYYLGSVLQEESVLLNLKNLKKGFTTATQSIYAISAFAKSKAEPRNSTDLSVANSTPLACFFIRSIRTPQERLEPHESPARLSMVAFGGKGFALCCVPYVAVFEPVKRYRQSLERKAVAHVKPHMELLAMIYLLKCVNRYAHSYQENIIKIQARNADEARWQLSAQYRLLHVIAQFPDRLSDYAEQKFAKLSQNLTRCNAQGVVNANMHSALEIINSGINHPLPKSEVGGNIIGTTSKNGHRTRKTCGFFTPQIPQIGLLHLLQAEFVARSIHRNKPSNRTNKVSRFFAVVEALPRLIGYGNSNLLNKENIKMLFKFLLTGKKRLTIRIRANSEQEARQQLNLSPNALCVARLPVQGGIYA